MKFNRQVDQIISDHLPAIENGQETPESVIAQHPQIASELLPSLEAVLWLRKARFALATRPGYIHDSRKNLEIKIESLPPRSFWQRLSKRYSPQRWVFNIASPVIIILLLALVINSGVLTARLSIPGEPLYSTKLAIEDIQLALTFNQVKRTELTIQFSRERALEFVDLVMEGKYEDLPSAAARMESDIITSLRSLSRISPEDASIEVNDFKESLSNEILLLNVLKSTSPGSAQHGIELAIRVAQSGILALR